MRFTIWNYRNIKNSKPVTFDLRDGITFVLGPNNIGKTNLIKFFYDFRAMLAPLNRDMLQGHHSATLETYFDHLKNRYSAEQSIRFYIESNNGCKAEFTIESLNPKIPNSFDVNVMFNLLAGNADNPSSNQFINDIWELVQNSFFVGQSRALSWNTFGRSLDMDTGNVFIKNYKQWADGDDIQVRKQIEQVKAELRTIFNIETFDIRVNAEGNNLLVSLDRETFLITELGSGIIEFVIVLCNAAIKRPTFIFIDEPETSLHPKMQEAFIRALAEKSKKSIVATSHSIALARSTADYLYSVTKTTDNSTLLQPFGQNYEPTIAQSISEMGYSQYVEIGGNNILLVEGRTDIKAFREILRKYSIESSFIILSLGGGEYIIKDQNRIVEELRELIRLNANSVNVILDSDREHENGPIKEELNTLRKTCVLLKFNFFATDRPSTENYITQTALDRVMGKRYKALELFEKFNSRSNNWPKEHNWRIFIEMRKEDFSGTGLDKFIVETLLPLTKK